MITRSKSRFPLLRLPNATLEQVANDLPPRNFGSLLIALPKAYHGVLDRVRRRRMNAMRPIIWNKLRQLPFYVTPNFLRTTKSLVQVNNSLNALHHRHHAETVQNLVRSLILGQGGYFKTPGSRTSEYLFSHGRLAFVPHNPGATVTIAMGVKRRGNKLSLN